MVVTELALSGIHLILSLHSFVWSWIIASLQFLTVKSVKAEFSPSHAKPRLSLPHHIGLVLTEDNIDLSRVARIVCLCARAGIPHISVYDREGFCKNHLSVLEESIKNQRLSNYVRGESSLSHLSNGSVEHHLLGCGGYTDLKLHVVSAEDGPHSLVNVARALSAAVSNNLMSIGEITSENIDKSLREKLDIPDPELVIQFGSTSCLMGYLPWHCRLTEILSCSSHRNMDDKKFESLLHSFMNTEQRFGK